MVTADNRHYTDDCPRCGGMDGDHAAGCPTVRKPSVWARLKQFWRDLLDELEDYDRA